MQNNVNNIKDISSNIENKIFENRDIDKAIFVILNNRNNWNMYFFQSIFLRRSIP